MRASRRSAPKPTSIELEGAQSDCSLMPIDASSPEMFGRWVDWMLASADREPRAAFAVVRQSSGRVRSTSARSVFWEDDPLSFQSPDEDVGGPNRVSLNQARKNFAEFGAAELKDKWAVRPPLPDEMPRS